MAATAVRESTFSPHVADAPSEAAPRPHWHPATRVAFRICFVYFGLYVLLTQMLDSMLLVPRLQIPELGLEAPFRQLTTWTGTRVLGLAPFTAQSTGSGDRTFYWVQAFEFLVIALVAAAVWTYVARDRTHHDRLYRWFRVFMRIAVGTTFFSYGFDKAVPLQMPNQLMRLVEPYGNFSMMGVLWASIGSSPGYEIFAGVAEVGAGTLLLIPGTARVGALVGLMDAFAVFMLNMTYDVPVKLFAFHLVLMSLFLLAPIARPLFELFLLHRPARIPAEPALGRSARARRGAIAAQVAFAIYMLVIGAWGAERSWYRFGGGSPRSPLYGIWEVRTMSIDGAVLPPLLTDTTRWRRAVFDAPQTMIIQRMDDRFVRGTTKIDTAAHTLAVTTFGRGPTRSTFTWARTDHAHLVLDGTMSGHAVHMELAFRNPNTFTQRSRGFNWVQEVPYNR
jgi:uncharacterized membrane protein YphA (DoxX/SURF4 family)